MLIQKSTQLVTFEDHKSAAVALRQIEKNGFLYGKKLSNVNNYLIILTIVKYFWTKTQPNVSIIR